MSRGIRKRYVTDPDGTKWIVGRHWLARRPRYIGYRFGADPYSPTYEPAIDPETDKTPIRRPHAGKLPAPNPYRDHPDHQRRSRGGGWIWTNWGGRGGWSSGRSAGGGSGRSGGTIFGGSSGGGSRGSSGRGSRSRSRGKGKGGGGAGAAGLLAFLVKVLKYILIAAAVVAVILFVIFVGAPALIFVAQYVLFWVLVGGTIVYNAVTGRPWIVKATRAGYERADYAFRVTGWRHSIGEIHQMAESIRRGDVPTVVDGEPVELIDH